MSKPLITVISCVVALLVVGLTVKHLLGGSGDDVAPSPEKLAAATDSARAGHTGWAAKPGTEAESDEPDRGGRVGRPRGSSGSRGGPLDDDDPAGSRGSAGSPGGSTGTWSGGGVGVGPGGIRVAPGAPVPGVDALPFAGAKSLKDVAARARDSHSTVTVAGGDTTDASGKPKEDGLVLSLPLKATSDPAAGEKPAVEQGVTYESAEGAHFSTDAQFVVPNAGNLKGEAGTIAFTMTPDWGGDDTGDASLVQLRGANTWENRLQVFKNGAFFRYLFTPDSGVETGVSVDTSRWAPGEQLNVAVTWGGETQDGQRTLQMYINGQMVGQAPYQGQLQIPPGAELRIGSDHPGAMAGARATIGGFQAFDSALPSERISGLGSGSK